MRQNKFTTGEEASDILRDAVASLRQDAATLLSAAGASASARRRKIGMLQLIEAADIAASSADLAETIHPDIDRGPKPVETLVRTNAERAIGVTWLADQVNGDEASDRYLKTNAGKFIKSGFTPDQEVHADAALPVNYLPDTTSMGTLVPGILDDWRRLSHLAHPFAGLVHVPDQDSYLRAVHRIHTAAEMHRRATDTLVSAMQKIRAADGL